MRIKLLAIEIGVYGLYLSFFRMLVIMTSSCTSSQWLCCSKQVQSRYYANPDISYFTALYEITGYVTKL